MLRKIKHMKNLLIISFFALCITSCKKDDPATTTSSSFIGNWTGTYIGDDDHGTFGLNISSTGDIIGTLTSQTFGTSYDFNGTVTSAGQLQATAGTGVAVVVFSGTLSGNSGNGTWQNTTVHPPISGTWTSTRQ